MFHISKKGGTNSMFTYIYDALFGYITFLFFEECYAIENKELADNRAGNRNRCDITRLFKRFSHILSRHPVSIKSTSA